MILLDCVAANICVYFQYLFMHFVCDNIFGAIVLKLRFNPHQNDQGRKGPCCFQRLITLKCLKCQKIKKISIPSF
jgi:hypothetical protein